MLPPIVFVTLKNSRVPTCVRLEVTTFDASVVPVSVPAAAAPPISTTEELSFFKNNFPSAVFIASSPVDKEPLDGIAEAVALLLCRIVLAMFYLRLSQV